MCPGPKILLFHLFTSFFFFLVVLQITSTPKPPPHTSFPYLYSNYSIGYSNFQSLHYYNHVSHQSEPYKPWLLFFSCTTFCSLELIILLFFCLLNFLRFLSIFNSKFNKSVHIQCCIPTSSRRNLSWSLLCCFHLDWCTEFPLPHLGYSLWDIQSLLTFVEKSFRAKGKFSRSCMS